MMNPHFSAIKRPNLGFGLRLRHEYLNPLLDRQPDVDWCEIISENYMDDADALDLIDRIGELYPLVMHGVSLSIGSPWPLNLEYLGIVKEMAERIQPQWISDHLCWSGADDIQGGLLPLPYSEEMLDHLVPRIKQVQEFLDRRILLENVPRTGAAVPQEMPEAAFLKAVAEAADSLILIDIGTLHTSSVNQEFDVESYLNQIPTDRLWQVHLSGAIALCGPADEAIDAPIDPVWALYGDLLKKYGPISTLVEREDTILSLDEMVKEVQKARCAARSIIRI